MSQNTVGNGTDNAGTPPPMEPLSGAGGNGNGQGNALGSLLRSPQRLIEAIARDEGLTPASVILLLWGLVFHALYGLAMSLFGGWEVAIMGAAKAPLIAVCSILLCMPSLYVFASVGGLPISVSQAFALASCVVAMVGLLLLGLTPVAWLFSVSTNSLGFTVLLNAVTWFVAVGFAFRFSGQLRTSGRFPSTAGLKWWLVVYVLVSLQMATTMRPLLTKPDDGWWTAKKQFFLAHLVDSFK